MQVWPFTPTQSFSTVVCQATGLQTQSLQLWPSALHQSLYTLIPQLTVAVKFQNFQLLPLVSLQIVQKPPIQLTILQIEFRESFRQTRSKHPSVYCFDVVVTEVQHFQSLPFAPMQIFDAQAGQFIPVKFEGLQVVPLSNDQFLQHQITHITTSQIKTDDFSFTFFSLAIYSFHQIGQHFGCEWVLSVKISRVVEDQLHFFILHSLTDVSYTG